jgi:hypothetical protein
MRVILTEYDHNAAKVDDFYFHAGEVGSGVTTSYKTQFKGGLLQLGTTPIPSNVVKITGAASCQDTKAPSNP